MAAIVAAGEGGGRAPLVHQPQGREAPAGPERQGVVSDKARRGPPGEARSARRISPGGERARDGESERARDTVLEPARPVRSQADGSRGDDHDPPARSLGAAPATAADELQRLDLYTRRALSTGDGLAATRALEFWRDSVASRADFDPRRKRAAAALIDTLATRFATAH